MPRLKMLRGPSPNHDFDLDESVITIGRGRKNIIIIQDNEVSLQIEKHEDVDLFLDVLGSILNTEIESIQLYVNKGEVLLKLNEASVHDLAA